MSVRKKVIQNFHYETRPIDCPVCHGAKRVPDWRSASQYSTCSRCGGAGNLGFGQVKVYDDGTEVDETRI
jgi:DnaJ-class molecular chaperone